MTGIEQETQDQEIQQNKLATTRYHIAQENLERQRQDIIAEVDPQTASYLEQWEAEVDSEMSKAFYQELHRDDKRFKRPEYPMSDLYGDTASDSEDDDLFFGDDDTFYPM